MAQVELLVTMIIVRGSDLPKTDTFSSIDPYVVCNIPNQPKITTKSIDNNCNPIWDHVCHFTLPFDPVSGALPELHFELWDQNSVSKDKQVGIATLKLTPNHLQQKDKHHELVIQHFDSKYSKHHSTISVKFDDYAYTCASLYKLASQYNPDITFNPHGLGRLYVPLKALGPVVLGLEYEKGKVDLKLYLTENKDEHYLELVRVGHPCSHVRRRKVMTPFTVWGNIKAYEEVKLDDVPFSEFSTPGKVLFFLFKKKTVSEVSLAEVVTSHGWSGAMDFNDASKKLRNVELDKAKEEIYMKRDDSIIVVDFDDDNVDMKCLILDVPQNNNVAYDFSFESPDSKKSSEIYVPPRPLLGKYMVQRKIELDDIPFGTPFGQMHWYKYALSDPVQVSLFDVIKVHPF